MVIMYVLMEELLYQAVMGRIVILECELSSVRGCMWLRLILHDIKWHRYSRTLALCPLA
jgi:hypothetical protein